MFDFEDRWWLVAVVLLVVLWVMGAVMPVRLLAPRMAAQQHFLTEDESPEQDAPPPVQRPSILLPSLVSGFRRGLVTLGIMKRMNEREIGPRGVWMSAAAGLVAFWAMLLIMISLRIR